MKGTGSTLLFLSVILLFGCTLFACGDNVELRPELQAQLDEYENLIDNYESRFAAARGKPSEFAAVADSYSKEAKAWINQWSTVAPNLSDEEGRAIKASIDELNKRATRMLTGN